MDPSQDAGRTLIAVAQLAITVAEPDANRLGKEVGDSTDRYRVRPEPAPQI